MKSGGNLAQSREAKGTRGMGNACAGPVGSRGQGHSGDLQVSGPARVPERSSARRAHRADDGRAEAEPPRRLPSR